ncbi:MAG: hypothetical protein ABSB41_13375 [Anaerolineales bacterium]|jgi:hypothetical protein
MPKRNRTQLVLGIILILAAAWLIAIRLQPGLTRLIHFTFDWPAWVLFAGAIILLIGLLVGEAGMAVPACIVAGIGGILYYQNATENWASWGYLWTLIPGFVGVGSILAGILGEDFKRSVRSGLNLLLISLVLFLIFATLLGGWTTLGPYSAYAPIVLLWLLGLWLIARGTLRSH